jgi:hypothetical protein
VKYYNALSQSCFVIVKQRVFLLISLKAENWNMKTVEYALVKRDKKIERNILSIASLKNQSVIYIESIIYLAFTENEQTYMYCCNNEAYKCLCSAIITENFDSLESKNI